MLSALKGFIIAIRPINLAIIAFTQIAIHQLLIVPILVKAHITPIFNFQQILMLAFATVLIAAGGYVINDYYDTEIDRINKPAKKSIGISLSRRTGMVIHLGLSAFGLLLAIFVAKTAAIKGIFLIYFIAFVLLWKYSETWKRQLWIGNFVISFLTVIAVFLPPIAESFTLAALYHIQQELTINAIKGITMLAIFAFLLTFIRELVKDAEDLKGDLALGCNTVPICYGIAFTQKLILSLMGLVVLSIFYFQFKPFALNKITQIYIFTFIHFNILLSAYFIGIKKNYKIGSTFVKLAQLGGVCTLILFYYLYA